MLLPQHHEEKHWKQLPILSSPLKRVCSGLQKYCEAPTRPFKMCMLLGQLRIQRLIYQSAVGLGQRDFSYFICPWNILKDSGLYVKSLIQALFIPPEHWTSLTSNNKGWAKWSPLLDVQPVGDITQSLKSILLRKM